MMINSASLVMFIISYFDDINHVNYCNKVYDNFHSAVQNNKNAETGYYLLIIGLPGLPSLILIESARRNVAISPSEI